MRELHSDEKIAVFVVSVTIIIILVILIVTNSIDAILKKYKKDNLVSCSSSVVENVVKYKNISCTVTDDDNKSYIFSILNFWIQQLVLNQLMLYLEKNIVWHLKI